MTETLCPNKQLYSVRCTTIQEYYPTETSARAAALPMTLNTLARAYIFDPNGKLIAMFQKGSEV